MNKFIKGKVMKFKNNKNIIVVDDDSSIRVVLSTALTRAGYNVKSSGTATGMMRLVEPNFAAIPNKRAIHPFHRHSQAMQVLAFPPLAGVDGDLDDSGMFCVAFGPATAHRESRSVTSRDCST